MLVSRPCYAKVNLFLEVLGKLPNGYHEIFTLFQAIAIKDTLDAQLHEQLQLTGADSVTPNYRDNLIYKAAKLMQENYAPGKGISFHLHKTLPAGAGLGGGSSNCAAAIQLCNELWGLNLDNYEMAEVGKSLGADVPFFIQGKTSFGLGTGTQLEVAPPPKAFHVVVATPNSSVNTTRAYELLNAKKHQPLHSSKEFIDHRLETDFYKGLTNDFEPVIFKIYPEIQTLRDKISEFGPVKVLLSGSGSSVFALFEKRNDADKCEGLIRNFTRFSAVTHFLGK